MTRKSLPKMKRDDLPSLKVFTSSDAKRLGVVNGVEIRGPIGRTRTPMNVHVDYDGSSLPVVTIRFVAKDVVFVEGEADCDAR